MARKRSSLILLVLFIACAALGTFGLLRKRAEIRDAIETHKEALAEGEADARVEAAAALTARHDGWFSGELNAISDDIMDALAAGLGADDLETRTRAAETIAAWGAPADAVVRRLLRDDDDATRIAAAYALTIRPRPVLRTDLSTALRDSRVEVRSYAADALGRTPLPTLDEEMIADLVFRLWKDESAWARNAAAEALFNQDNWTGIPMLVNSLNGRFWTRFNAYERLTRIYRKLGKPLPPFYADGHAARRAAEVRAIEDAVLADPVLHARVLAQLAEFKSQIMTATRWTVHLMGRHVVGSLTDVLTGGGPQFADRQKAKFVRVHSAQGIADLADPAQSAPATYRENRPVLIETARPVLRRLVSDAKARSDVDLTMQVLRALGHLGDDSDIARLAPLMADANPDIAITAIRTTGAIGGDTAVKALTALEATGEREDERKLALAAARRARS